MKTRYSKIFYTIALITVLLAILLIIPSFAETAEAELIYLDETTNLKVTVEYTDNGTGLPPVISFRDSWNRVLEEGMEEVQADYFEGAVVYTLPDLSSGRWYIVYDDSFSGHLHVTTAPYARLLKIENLNLDARNNYLYADLLVSSEKEYGYYTVEFSAVILDENGMVTGSRLLDTFSGNLNYNESYSINIEKLATYDNYYLQAEVYINDNGIETVTNTLAGPFAHTSDYLPEALNGIMTTAFLNEKILRLDWSSYTRWNVSNYIIGVFKNEETEPFFSASYEPDVTEVSVNYPEDAKTVTVCISYTDDYGYVSQTLSKTVDLENLTVTFNIKDDISSSSVCSFEYETKTPDTEIYVSRNGENIGSYKISDKGSLNFNTADGVNTITICYYPDADTTVYFEYEFFCDMMPPLLVLNEIDGNVTTKDTSYIIAGTTEPGATLTVNGTQYEVDENGIFTINISLVSGENGIEIVSSDVAGNKTVKNFSINCLNRKAGSKFSSFIKNVKLLLICACVLVVSLGILITAAILAKKSSGWTKKDKFRVASVFAWILAGISGVCAIYAVVKNILYSKKINSLDFVDIAKESINKAADMLDKSQFFKSFMGWMLIAFGVFTVAAVILTILGRKKKD